MKNFLSIYILLLPLISYADTLDYWSVYLNDSLIGKYNSLSIDNEIVLKNNIIAENDTISIVYGNDHPCGKCEYYYAVKDLKHEVKIHVERRNNILEPVFFPLLKLTKFEMAKEFEIFVYEISYEGDKNIYSSLFRIE